MDAIELLEKQHREVEALFEKFEKTGDRAVKARMDLFTRIADNFAAHALIEEKLFYPSVYVEGTEDKLREAVEEHLSVKRVLADLLDMEPSDEQFMAKMKVLQELVEHHVEEEEESLFPGVKKQLAKEELASLGEQMEQMFSELIQGEPRLGIPDETDAAPPLA